MKKYYTILVFFIFTTLQAQSPTYQWGKFIGGSTSNEYANSVTVDASGNIITVGRFDGTTDLDPSAGVASFTSAGGNDLYITKTDSNGNFVWAKKIGGSDQDVANDVAIDSNGNIFIAGYFAYVVDFNPGAGVNNMGFSGGFTPQGFLLKLDSNGNYVWSKQFSVSAILGQQSIPLAVSIDSANNVLLGGYFVGTMAIDSEPIVYTSASSSVDSFYLKYNNSGVFQWSKQLTSVANDSLVDIRTDASNNVYITGHFNGALDFDPSTAAAVTLTPTGGFDSFLLKMDTNGNFGWANKTSGTGNEYGRAVAIDNIGNILWGGNYDGTVDFDPSAGINNLTSTGNTDNFISKIDGSGNYLWTYGFGGVNSDFLSSLAVDSDNNVYSTGNFSGTVDFNSSAGTSNFTSNGGVDIYIEKVSSTGTFVWAWAFGGQSLGGTNDVGNGLILDSSNNLYTVGYVGAGTTFPLADIRFDQINFSPGSLVTPNGAYDVFMLKLQSGTLSTNEFNTNNLKFNLYPNPSTDFVNISLDSEIKSVEIYSVQGQKVSTSTEKEINVSSLSNGMYMVRVEDENGAIATQKMMKN